MTPNHKHPTVIHFVANIGGGVWSVAKTLAEHHRPRWRRFLVGVYKAPLQPEFAAEAESLFDGAYLASRPSFPGSYHLLPLRVSTALAKLGVDPLDERNVYHFHTGPYTPLVYHLPRGPRRGKWLSCFHGARGNFGDTHSVLKRSLHRRCVRQMLREQFTLASVSARGAQDCAAMYGCQADDFQIVYNGAEGPVSGPPPARLQPHAPFHVGFVGSLIPIKGWRKVVDAVQQLRYSGRDVVCSIVGDGPQRDDLARLARQHAAWLRAPGHVPDPQANVFPELDALLLPSEFEGHPRVLLEAMAGGVPCVCSDVGGNAETIRDGQEGFVLHESTAEEIAQRLGQLISTPGLWPQLSASCVRRHAEMFTADRMADNWERLYLEGPASTTCTAAASA